MELAIKIWNEHIAVFEEFDLVCHNGNSLEDETKSNALFNALVTLRFMQKFNCESTSIQEAIDYLKKSKYYSESNEGGEY